MKTALLSFFFLFAISTTLPSASADFVFDTDGDLVRNGGAYYMVSKIGHGLEIAQLPNDNNPVSVVQSATDYSNGLPLRLTSPLLLLHIHTEMYLNIEFVGVTNGVWEVVDNSVKIYRELTFVGPFRLETYEKGLYNIFYTSNSTSTPLRVSAADRLLNLDEGDLLIVEFKNAATSSLGSNIA